MDLSSGDVGFPASVPGAGKVKNPRGINVGGSTAITSPTADNLSIDEKIQLDWKAYLQDWGFPKEVVAQLDNIFKKYPDAQAAGAASLAYIRGTDWYRATFPGINEGIKKGIVADERDYRSYVNQVTDSYKRFAGRDVTSNEIAAALGAGHNAGYVAAQQEGGAWAQTHGQETQYQLGAFGGGQVSQGDLQTLGEQQSGLSSVAGMQLDEKLKKAQGRIASIFQGTLATPSMSLATGRLSAPSLSGGSNPDYGA